MTLVELLVAMTITAIVLTGLVGVLYNVGPMFDRWEARIGDASTGAGLSAVLQADSHRYPVCQNAHRGSDPLVLCLPSGDPVLTYTVVPSGSTYAIVRTELPGGRREFVARGLHGRPELWSECLPYSVPPDPQSSTVSGHIHVYNFRLDARSSESFSVYYVAPRPVAGCPPP